MLSVCMTGSPFFCAGLSISLAEFGEIGAVPTTATFGVSQRAADSMDGRTATSLTRCVTVSQADGA